MHHVIAPDESTSVREPLGVIVIGRLQQQRRAVGCSGRNHEGSATDLERFTVAMTFDRRHATVVRHHTMHLRVGQQSNVTCGDRRLKGVGLRVGLRCETARKPITGAASNAGSSWT